MPYPAMSLSAVHALLTAPGSMLEVVEADVRGRRQRVWKNAPPTLREIFGAGRAHGARDFLVYENERATFEGLARAAVVFAHELQKQGVAKGDRVAVAMRNLPEWPAAFFGAMLAGAVVVPLNAWSTGLSCNICWRIAALWSRWSTPSVSTASPRISPPARACGASTSRAWRRRRRARIGSRTSWARRRPWAALPALDLPSVELAPDDDATIFYTSGTTGKPKGALGTHRNACSTLFARAYGKAAAALRRGEAPPVADPSAPQESTLLSVPFFHVTGCFSTMIPAYFAGVKIATMRRWDALEALKLIERERINGAGGVPTIAWQLIEHPDFDKYDTSSLISFSYGGAPAPADLVRRLRSASPAAALATAWGMTETSAPFTIVIGEDYEAHPTTCGYALPVGEIRIVGADGLDKPNA